MQLLIIGTGYVGLVTGACFAEMGHTVTCLDIDIEKIARLQQGIIPIYEPGLEEIVKRNVKEHRLFFTTDYAKAASSASVCFIAVPTPSNEDGSCDMSYVESAAKQIALYMKGYTIIVNKSTVPVGTAHHIQTIIKQINPELDFDVVSNPEFLKEGAAVQDCLKPDRIIIGSDHPKPAEILKAIYAPYTLNHEKIILMDTLSAEMTKYAANAMLATRISFMNEIAGICKKVGADVNKVRKGIGSDSRIGYSFLYPGVGYGGSCFPKDVRALIQVAKKAGSQPTLLEAADIVNDRQKTVLSEIMTRYFAKKGGLKDKTIAVWGLAFKPDTDDMREAPSITFIKDAIKQGARLRVFDPVAMPNAQKMLEDIPNIEWCKDEFDAANMADAIALLTEWKQFRLVDFNPIRKNMKGFAFFDGRNQYKSLEMLQNGFDYLSIGVPDALRQPPLPKERGLKGN
jgi:UDPglucose 6-dehydrogenase